MPRLKLIGDITRVLTSDGWLCPATAVDFYRKEVIW